MKVLKFGGTSVGSADNIRRVGDVVASYQATQQQIWVVVSAMGGVTNKLIQTAQLALEGDENYLVRLEELRQLHLITLKDLNGGNTHEQGKKTIDGLIQELKDLLHGIFLLKELSNRSLDIILSFGERLSANIIVHYLKAQSVACDFLDTRQLIKTDSHFGNAKVDFKKTNANIQSHFGSHPGLHIVTGFIASNDANVTTTLGRGGSDYTASIIAAALEADEVEIWTDVDGVMTADPRKVKEAYSMPHLSYVEAMEMSHFGAKVIYPPTLQPAINKKIPLRIRNTFNPSFEGTFISKKTSTLKFPVKGVSSIEQVTLVSLIGSGMVGVPGVASRLFGALARNHINVILITQASSEHSITFAVSPTDTVHAQKTLKEEFSLELRNKEIETISVEEDLSVVAIIGENMKHTPGIAGRLFNAFGKNGINVAAIAQGSSELNISVVINHSNLSKALNALHEAFFLSDQKSLNIFLLGSGLIGGTLLRQISEQHNYLLNERALKINVVGVANSRNMAFDEGGIDLKDWRKLIDFPGKNSHIDEFIAKMREMNLSNSVFVDCTSNQSVIKHYEEILNSSISIVTPNKLANSGKFANYTKLRKAAVDHGCKFLYETNVGAGLPIISTMNDLKISGDKIRKIEGVLSGTISYIFNSFVGDTKFSDVVKEAKEKGLTEPDPRDDLNGMDVARKILILSREAGLQLEPEDVKLEPILPESCFKVDTVDQFFAELEKVDDQLSSLRDQAAADGKVLRLIASMEKGQAQIKLEQVGPDHPFYSLSGSDNVVSFTTKRYYERPLVVKGPGAGAEVTSAGVFAEIISISNHFIQDNYKFGTAHVR
ncbi:MAG: bifunctional aspartate kinase/homoserine dehydrogenase I [Cyclobacteriaceae bacterium]